MAALHLSRSLRWLCSRLRWGKSKGVRHSKQGFIFPSPLRPWLSTAVCPGHSLWNPFSWKRISITSRKINHHTCTNRCRQIRSTRHPPASRSHEFMRTARARPLAIKCARMSEQEGLLAMMRKHLYGAFTWKLSHMPR